MKTTSIISLGVRRDFSRCGQRRHFVYRIYSIVSSGLWSFFHHFGRLTTKGVFNFFLCL